MTLSIANIDYQRLLRLRAKGGMKKKNDRSVRFYDNIHLRIPLNFKTRSLSQPFRMFLAAKHPLRDVQHVQRGNLVVFPFVFAYRTSFHPDDKS